MLWDRRRFRSRAFMEVQRRLVPVNRVQEIPCRSRGKGRIRWQECNVPRRPCQNTAGLWARDLHASLPRLPVSYFLFQDPHSWRVVFPPSSSRRKGRPCTLGCWLKDKVFPVTSALRHFVFGFLSFSMVDAEAVCW